MLKTIKNLVMNEESLNKIIAINGWIKAIRNNGPIGFIELYDGTSFKRIQIVYKKNELENYNAIKALRPDSAIKVTGKIVKSVGKEQGYEVHATKIEIYRQVDEDYPLQKKFHSLEFLREIAHLRARTDKFFAIFKIRSSIAQAIHQFFAKKDFLYLHAPIITANDAEGAGEAFIVTTRNDSNYDQDFFNKKAALTVSGQLNAEAFAQAFQKVYTFGPTFRAENSNTTRHAAEFWMIEPEVAFSTLEDNMKLGEELLKYMYKYILKNNKLELNFLNEWIDKTLIKRLKKDFSQPFARMTYTEVIDALLIAKEKNPNLFQNNNIKWGMDLNSEHERYICEQLQKKPTFVIDYPQDIKAFYMKLNADGKTVAAMDLLVPNIGELIGGSVRENDYDKLFKQAEKQELNFEELQWYLDLRKFGYAPSAGFGVGFERLIMYFTGMTNIRDVIAFPRTPGNLKF